MPFSELCGVVFDFTTRTDAIMRANTLEIPGRAWYSPRMPKIALIQQEAVAEPAENKQLQMQ